MEYQLFRRGSGYRLEGAGLPSIFLRTSNPLVASSVHFAINIAVQNPVTAQNFERIRGLVQK